VDWFANLGNFAATDGVLVIQDLETPEGDDEWDWLPTTTLGQDDPVSRAPLKQVAAEMGRGAELRSRTNEFYKVALRSLRKAPSDHPLLHVGPHDVTPAAIGAALFAVRHAVAEIVIESPGFWCALIPIYAGGNWPLGVADDGRLVVL
jgi:hypothetical protein